MSNLFGLNTTRKDSKVILIPVPWEVTTSYGSGTSLGPQAILEASPQIDLFDLDFGPAYKDGFHLENIDSEILANNTIYKEKAQEIINSWDEFGNLSSTQHPLLKEVNAASTKMVNKVYNQANEILAEKKIPAVLGGDHSTPLGLIQAISEHTLGDFGILHFDAHADLRIAYQGFEHSHASIMHNVMSLPRAPKSLVQVGIRDFCQEEFDYIQSDSRIHTYFDRKNKTRMFDGSSWNTVCQDILGKLPNNVYVSFDIDGLSPEFCPHTGTPVPGGLSFDQAVHLLSLLGKSGRKIVGFDLNEVAPGLENEWDANVGARILFKLCGWAARSNN